MGVVKFVGVVRKTGVMRGGVELPVGTVQLSNGRLVFPDGTVRTVTSPNKVLSVTTPFNLSQLSSVPDLV